MQSYSIAKERKLCLHVRASACWHKHWVMHTLHVLFVIDLTYSRDYRLRWAVLWVLRAVIRG